MLERVLNEDKFGPKLTWDMINNTIKSIINYDTTRKINESHYDGTKN